MCDARTETERLLAEQRDRALSDRDRAEAHLDECMRVRKRLRLAMAQLLDAVAKQDAASGLIPYLLDQRSEALRTLSDTAGLKITDDADLPIQCRRETP